MEGNDTTESAAAVAIAIAIGAGVAWAGSHGGVEVAGFPVFALCAAVAFGLNWLAALPAIAARTEHFYDLTGGLTYLTVIATAAVAAGPLDTRGGLVAGMVMVWAARLASFLFLRIRASGGDGRFDTIKGRPLRFFMAWTLQGLWVLLTASAALAILTGGSQKPLGAIGVVGVGLWGLGMAIEIIADRQKSAFRADPANHGRFIDTGLWAWSRHPNYFGEIVLWSGIAVLAVPVLDGWRWATLVSPAFVALLLLKISGVPLLEQRADERWGGQSDYETYKRRTATLIPRPPSSYGK